jgi:hypothetical protein
MGAATSPDYNDINAESLSALRNLSGLGAFGPYYSLFLVQAGWPYANALRRCLAQIPLSGALQPEFLCDCICTDNETYLYISHL